MRPTVFLAALFCLGAAPVSIQAREFEIPNRDTTALAAAIRAANAQPGPDTIRLAEGGLYPLTAIDTPGLLLPAIHGELAIEGRGAELRRYIDGRLAVLAVAADAQVRVTDLTLAEGTNGALLNFGQLRLDRVRIHDSTASDTPAIVLNHGRLEAHDCEFAYNSVPATGRDAGTVVNYGTLVLRGGSIHDNLARRRYPTLAVAGAVLNLGEVDVAGAGFADNQADDDAGGLAVAGILNLGNGRVSGDAGAGVVHEAGRPPMLASRR